MSVYQDPDGTVHNSTDFDHGSFRLLITNPVKGGNYTCRIPPQHLVDACVPINATHQGETSLFMDKVDARLMLLENENERLKLTSNARYNQLLTMNDFLRQRLDTIEGERESVVSVNSKG